jgi:hypothetical protein
MLLTVRKEPDRFGVDEIEATQLEHTIMQLEGSLLPPRAFEVRWSWSFASDCHRE